MPINHVIVELHCAFDKDEDKTAPHFCRYGIKYPGYHCLENSCAYLSYTKAPNEIAYSDCEGESQFEEDSWIGFGGDMNPESLNNKENYENLLEIWKGICKKKIKESYDEYMKLTEEIRKK